MKYQQTATALKNLLDSCESLNVVYDHEPDELVRYPAATLSSDGHDGEFRSTAHNELNITTIIRIYFLTANGRDQEAEMTLRSCMDEVVTKLVQDPTLGDTCAFAAPSMAKIQPADREVPTLVAEITVRAKHFVSRLP